MVEELYIFYMFTMVHASMFMVEPLSPYMYVVMVSFLAGTVLVDLRNITIHHELRLDLWLCVGVVLVKAFWFLIGSVAYGNGVSSCVQLTHGTMAQVPLQGCHMMV